jgi:hypothetical protein
MTSPDAWIDGHEVGRRTANPNEIIDTSEIARFRALQQENREHQAKHDLQISRAAALTMKAEAEIAILACVNREKTIEWLRGLKAALEAIAALPLPGDAP